jgi:hypothetical protein
MLTAQVHGGLMAASGVDLLAQTHMGLLAAVVIPVQQDDDHAFGGGYGPLVEARRKRRVDDQNHDILMIIKAIAEVLQ